MTQVGEIMVSTTKTLVAALQALRELNVSDFCLYMPAIQDEKGMSFSVEVRQYGASYTIKLVCFYNGLWHRHESSHMGHCCDPDPAGVPLETRVIAILDSTIGIA